MPGTMTREDERVGNPLTTSREPVGPKRPADKGSLGDQALMDAIALVAVAWIIVVLVFFSLRRHNV